MTYRSIEARHPPPIISGLSSRYCNFVE